jgi:hypothetical protein
VGERPDYDPAVARTLLVLTSLVLVASSGCQVGPDERPLPSTVDPVRIVSALPTPPELRDERAASAVDARTAAGLLGSGEGSGAGRKLTDNGFLRGATRSWVTPGGGTMEVVVSVWRNRQTASGIGGKAAERALSLPGARAWSPSDLRGVRGAEAPAATPPRRALSRAVVQNGLYVTATGDVPAATVVRAMKRLSLLVEGSGGTSGASVR